MQRLNNILIIGLLLLGVLIGSSTIRTETKVEYVPFQLPYDLRPTQVVKSDPKIIRDTITVPKVITKKVKSETIVYRDITLYDRLYPTQTRPEGKLSGN
jgi:hypothetical protein